MKDSSVSVVLGCFVQLALGTRGRISYPQLAAGRYGVPPTHASQSREMPSHFIWSMLRRVFN